MARIVVTLRRFERRQLLRWASRRREPGVELRARIVVLYAEGWGCDRVAAMLKVAPTTAARTARRFLELGYEGLLDARRENGTPKVDEDLLVALAELVRGCPLDFGFARPTWTRELLALALRTRVGMRVSLSTISRMLRDLGARRGRPRPIVVCPWPRKRKQARLRAIQRTLHSLGPDEMAFFEDEVDIHLNPKLGADWMLRGQQKVVVTPGQNEKRFLAGALSADGEHLVWVAAKRKNSDLFLDLLQTLLDRFPAARRLHLVLDNYVIHSSARVKRFLQAQNGRIVLHFLPPYSPEANRIERLWLDLHANVTRNHRCSSIPKLMSAVHSYLRRESRRRRRDAHSNAPARRVA